MVALKARYRHQPPEMSSRLTPHLLWAFPEWCFVKEAFSALFIIATCLSLWPLSATPSLPFSSPNSAYCLPVNSVICIASLPDGISSWARLFVFSDGAQVLDTVGTLLLVSTVHGRYYCFMKGVSRCSPSTFGVLNVWFDLQKVPVISLRFRLICRWLACSGWGSPHPKASWRAAVVWGRRGVPVHLAAPEVHPSPGALVLRAGFWEKVPWQKDCGAQRGWNSLLYVIEFEWVPFPRYWWTSQPFLLVRVAVKSYDMVPGRRLWVEMSRGKS